MHQFSLAVGVFTAISLGLSAGALLTEACVLVPIWRFQDPESFLTWYKRHAGLLLKYFGPLEAASGILVVASTGLAWFNYLPGLALFAGSTGLIIAVLISFPVYFKDANAKFERGSLDIADVGAELNRWAAWHWARTVLAIAAFGLAILALAQPVFSTAA